MHGVDEVLGWERRRVAREGKKKWAEVGLGRGEVCNEIGDDIGEASAGGSGASTGMGCWWCLWACREGSILSLISGVPPGKMNPI
jgi:hypothetical protein